MIRKLLTVVEETHHEAAAAVSPPTRKAAAIAVIDNPCAGQEVADLAHLIELGEQLGGLLGQRAVAALGIQPADAQSYGKAAIVGEDGELEHAAAILHPKLGAPLRRAVQQGAALVPSAKKRGAMGSTIDVPLGHKDAAYVRRPLRRHGNPRAGCTATRRNRRRRGGDRQRPAQTAHRRPDRAADRGQRWIALTRRATARSTRPRPPGTLKPPRRGRRRPQHGSSTAAA